MSRSNQVGAHKTVVYTGDDGYTRVIYQKTPVVKFDDKQVIFNTGGWVTNTTIRRMNQAINQYNLFNGKLVKIMIRKGEACIQVMKNKPVSFKDNLMIVDR